MFDLTDPHAYAEVYTVPGRLYPSRTQQEAKATRDSKVHGAYMGPTLGRQDPGEPHVGLMNLAIRDRSICIH